ncbi:unnamed protein product [Sympodiomycopsis kandeliae]
MNSQLLASFNGSARICRASTAGVTPFHHEGVLLRSSPLSKNLRIYSRNATSKHFSSCASACQAKRRNKELMKQNIPQDKIAVMRARIMAKAEKKAAKINRKLLAKQKELLPNQSPKGSLPPSKSKGKEKEKASCSPGDDHSLSKLQSSKGGQNNEERKRVSQEQYDRALKERETLRKPFGRFRYYVEKWSDQRSTEKLLETVPTTPIAPLPGNVISWNQPWVFAQQPLHFPLGTHWPPRLPLYSDLPQDTTLQSHSKFNTTFGAVYASRTPRDLAAVALAVQGYSVAPKRIECKGDPQVIWKFSPERQAIQSDLEERAWQAEGHHRLELMGDSISRTFALEVLFFRFPDMSSTGFNLAAAHLCMNDTFTKMYEISGLDAHRKELAETLFAEAVQKEKEKYELEEVSSPSMASSTNDIATTTTTEQWSTPDTSAIGPSKADYFEAYLAYLYLMHGPNVAEEWFTKLSEPWLNRIAADKAFMQNDQFVSAAGLLRRELGTAHQQQQQQQGNSGWKRFLPW